MNEFEKILEPIINDSNVNKMKDGLQHGTISTFEHCYNVANKCYKLNQKFNFTENVENLVLGAFLHDFFLYDWHNIKCDNIKELHGFSHPKIAATNAKNLLNMNNEVCDIISTHMWPLNITAIPRTKEAWIVCIVDKYVSLIETMFCRKGDK